MRLAPVAAVRPAASVAGQPGAVVLGSIGHARRPSEGHQGLVVELSTRSLLRPAARMHPLATRSHKWVDVSNVVTIVTDDPAIEASMASLIARAGYRVVSFGGGDAFLAGEFPANSGCILLDMQMSGVDGLEVLRALGSRESMPPVLVLSGQGDIHEAVAAMKLGAVDFLEKPCLPDSLLAAIDHAVDNGPRRKVAAIDRDAAARVASLSRRQFQVLQGILKGKPNKIIAYELGLSVRTAEAYRARLLEKLSVRGTAEAVRLATAAGML